nr:hypothetical protein [Tanacetum cinerariifolium]
MTLPDKDQLKFNIHKDAKTLMEAIEKRFEGNKETKKVQKTLLKQQYENFSGTSYESLDQIHDRLQKLISQLEILRDKDLFKSKDTQVEVAAAKLPILNPNEFDLWNMRIEQYFLMTNYSLWKVILNGDSPTPTRIVDGVVQSIAPTTAEQRECRSPRDNRNKDTPRRTVSVEAHHVLQDQIMRSKTCSKAYATLQTHYDNLYVEFRKSQFDVLSYKTELYSHGSDNSVPTSPENDRYKTCKGYHALPPLYTKVFLPCKPDLVFNDAPNASESVPNVVNVKSSPNKPSKDMSKTLRPNAPIIEDWTSDSEDETKIESVPKQKDPSFVLTSKHVKTPRESVKKVESLNHLIKDYDYYEKQMVQKPMWNSAMRVNHPNSIRMTHPHSNSNVVPTIILTRSRLVSFNAARPIPTVVPQSTMKSPRPVKHVINKEHSHIRRPINHRPATKNSNFFKKVTTIKVNKVNAVHGVKGNADKASANWDLRAEFEEFSFNSTNRVNAVSAPVTAARLNLTNSTNTASPFDTAVRPNFRITRKSSIVDPSKYLDDLDMPELEDIVYLDDEEDVGVEVDLSNLETNISVSLIPATRVHKDHLVTQIISDLTLALQTRSMTRMVKEQGGLHQTNDEDFHTYMFTCFLSQEEPKKVHQVLKDPS